MIHSRTQGKFGDKMTRREAAEYLGIKENTLATWASTGRNKLPFIKVGHRVFYRLSDLDAFMENNIQTQTF
ncbi:helix-turn-helix domain-containing protein [Thaumasiovibrio subtropicus]|uniref:helix-turn-helix domain-containing protein n=1 Tax=Thaumasiovibrio subtropicus TaxID=1891207 RepID=UPI00192D0CE1|nr:helix-turn-helix domain-containing protein [Thaumasiovibrio subtropicus]